MSCLGSSELSILQGEIRSLGVSEMARKWREKSGGSWDG